MHFIVSYLSTFIIIIVRQFFENYKNSVSFTLVPTPVCLVLTPRVYS